jgi:hypothetical protein
MVPGMPFSASRSNSKVFDLFLDARDLKWARVRNVCHLTEIDPELPDTTGSFRAVNSRHVSRGRYWLHLVIALEHDGRFVPDAVQFETHVAPRRIASEHHHAAL